MQTYMTNLIMNYGQYKGKSQKKLYQELNLESLRNRRWYRKLFFFYKIKNKLSSACYNTYLYKNDASPADSTKSSITKWKFNKNWHPELKVLNIPFFS